MSLKSSQTTTTTSRPVLLAAAKAIKALEEVTGTFKEHYATSDDKAAFERAIRLLWDILEGNGYTIDIDTNRLKKQELP